jgi:lipoprotein-releasing system permease protein
MMLESAQELLDLGPRITAIEMKADNAEDVTSIRPRVESIVKREELQVRDWKEMNRNLFSALKLEKIATFIILSIAIAVASFCIICTLLLMVTEKSKEIAILKALGASDRSILRIFMMEGIMIGGIGTVLGLVTGLSLTLGLLWFGVRLDPDVYYVDRLPIAVEAPDYFFVALSALVITTLATIYPALAASRLRPVDGIRYE